MHEASLALAMRIPCFPMPSLGPWWLTFHGVCVSVVAWCLQPLLADATGLKVVPLLQLFLADHNQLVSLQGDASSS